MIVLWNTLYMDAVLAELRSEGYPVRTGGRGACRLSIDCSLALGVTEKRAILTPGFAIFDQLEFPTEQRMEGMRYPKMLAHTAFFAFTTVY